MLMNNRPIRGLRPIVISIGSPAPAADSTRTSFRRDSPASSDAMVAAIVGRSRGANNSVTRTPLAGSRARSCSNTAFADTIV